MKTFTIRLEDNVKKQLRLACDANATTPSQIARKLLTEWVKTQENTSNPIKDTKHEIQ